jgi:hypothetical protein
LEYVAAWLQDRQIIATARCFANSGLIRQLGAEFDRQIQLFNLWSQRFEVFAESQRAQARVRSSEVFAQMELSWVEQRELRSIDDNLKILKCRLQTCSTYVKGSFTPMLAMPGSAR